MSFYFLQVICKLLSCMNPEGPMQKNGHVEIV